jgi:predicted membrane channel-forming protein YqfA (hemolysin III family)
VLLLPVILALIVFAAVVTKRRPDRPRKIEGWSAFFAWALVGVLLAFTIVAILSVGILAFPFFVALAAMMIWARPPRHSLLGLVAGIGALVLVLGVLHLADSGCQDEGTMVDGVIVYGYGSDDSETSCSDFNAMPWLAVGGALLVTGTVLFAAAERRASSTEVREDAL